MKRVVVVAFFGFFKSCLFSFAGGWKDSVRNIVVVFQTTSLRIVRFYVRCSAHFFGISFHKLFLASLPPQIPSPLPPTNPPSTLHTHTSPLHTHSPPHTPPHTHYPPHMLDVRLIFLPFLFTNYFWLPSPHTNSTPPTPH